jgi:uncharacterized repeat protein (TIGR02059 family)
MAGFGFGHGFSRRQQFRAGPANVAESVEVAGVTFTFAAARPVGQYANGDWWVLGPVSITAISPASVIQASGTDGDGLPFTNRRVHGAMLNPGNRVYAPGGLTTNNLTNPTNQGFDTLAVGVSGMTYLAGQNVDPGATGAPLAVSEGTVMKFVSALTGLPPQNRPVGLDMVPLTVVSSIPAADAIRPGISRASKASPCRLSQFNLGVFQNLAPTASAPTYAQALDWVDRYLEAAYPDFINNNSAKGINNHPEYGRDVGNNLHRAMLCLHLSSFTSEQKRTLLSHMAAIADDLVSRAEEGAIVLGGGGGNQWKKPVIALCAAALGSNAPASWLTYLAEDEKFRWAEDSQIFRVSGFDIGLPRFTGDGRPRSAYTYQMLGSAEWGEATSYQPERGGSNWNAFYRDIVAYSLYPGVLAVELTTGAKALWDHPEFWLYMDTVYLRRTEGGGGNTMLAFPLEMTNAYRPAKVAAPALLEAGIKNAAIWLRFDQALNELVTAPAASAFVVNVNGSPVTVSSVSIWRQNIGLALAAAVSGNDVVTVSYTVPGTNPARSVDGVNIASFTGQALTNRTDKVGGPNAAYPVVQFAPGVRRTLAGGGLAAADSQVATIALLRFRFPALPASAVELIGNSSGVPGLRLFLNTGGALELRLNNAGGTAVARVGLMGVGLLPNTDYDILISVDMTQANAAAGMNCYVNGTLQTVSQVTWVSGGTVGWTRPGTAGTVLNFNNFTFRMGAFYLNTATRLDLTNSANRAEFTSVTAGNLDILTRGNGITGSIPAQFLVGNDEQWNDGSGMNRGSAAGRWFVTSGAVRPVSGGEWG